MRPLRFILAGLLAAGALAIAVAQPPAAPRLKPSAAKVPENIVADGLVAYYDFEEGKGDVVHDRTGRGNDGKVLGGEFVKVKQGFAMKFDGIDDCVDCGDPEDLNPVHDFTLEAWVWIGKAWAKDYCGVLGKAPWIYGFCCNNGANLSFTISSGYNQVSNVLEPEKWRHVAVTYDGYWITFYVDGVQVQQRPTKHRMVRTGANFFIGRSAEDPRARWGGFFPGMIDEVRVYNRALSDEEIMRNYGQSMPLVTDVYGGFRTRDGGAPK